MTEGLRLVQAIIRPPLYMWQEELPLTVQQFSLEPLTVPTSTMELKKTLISVQEKIRAPCLSMTYLMAKRSCPVLLALILPTQYILLKSANIIILDYYSSNKGSSITGKLEHNIILALPTCI